MHSSTRHILLRKLWLWFWGTVAVVLMLLAIIMSSARALLPYASEYKSEIEQAASQALGYQVSIESISAVWDVLEPGLQLKGVSLADSETQKTVINVQDITITAAIIESVRSKKFVPDDIVIAGVALDVFRDQKNSVFVQGIEVAQETDVAQSEIKLPLFFQGKTLRVLDSQVHYRDDILKLDYTFNDVNAAIRDSILSHDVYLMVDLPESLGSALEIGMEMTGDYQDIRDWQGVFYIKGEAIQIPAWLQKFPLDVPVSRGNSSFELWLDYQGDFVEALQGDIKVQSFASGAYVVDALQAQAYIAKSKNNYLINLDNINIENNLTSLKNYGLTAELVKAGDGSLQSFRFAMDKVDIADALHVVEPVLRKKNSTLFAQLEEKKLAGDLSDVYIKWHADDALQASTGFSELSIDAGDNIPAVSGLSGKLAINGDSANILFASTNIGLDFKGLFRDKLGLEKLTGGIRLNKEEDVVTVLTENLVLSNPHITLDVNMGMRIEKGYSPYLNLNASIRDGDAAFTSQYLPTNMPPPGMRWLDTAIKSGKVVQGDAEVRGYLSDFPFKNQQGIFRIDIDVNDLVMQYHPDWPEATLQAAHIKFFESGLLVDIHKAKSGGMSVFDSTGVISDFKSSGLALNLKAYGDTSSALGYLRAIPLQKSMAGFLDNVEGAGEQMSQLQIDVGLHKGQKSTISGATALRNNRFDFPEWHLSFEDVNTRVRYTRQSLDMEESSLVLNGHPATIKAVTQNVSGNVASELVLRGSLSASSFIMAYAPELSPYAGGDFDFESVLTLPFAQNKRSHENIHLQVKSNLLGVGSTLPAPLGKAAADEGRLKARLSFLEDKHAELTIDYQDWLQGKLLLSKANNKTHILKGHFGVNDRNISLPVKNRMLLSGSLPELDLDAWLALPFHGQSNKNQKPIDEMTLSIKRLRYLQRDINDIDVRVLNGKRGLTVYANAEAIKGKIMLPINAGKVSKLTLDLEHVDLNKIKTAHKGAAKEAKPEALPPIRFDARKFTLNGWHLKNVSFETKPVAKGMKIDRLSVQDKSLNLNAQGTWLNNGKGQHTRFHVDMKTDDIGVGLHSLGIEKLIKGGEGTAQFDVNWAASPMDFDYGLLWGSANLSFEDGQIVELEAGAGGRLFGLISLGALTKRLTFDFKDVFSKGYNFDRMKGSFSFAKGDAFTDNFEIRSSAGRININGRTGLKTRDYDQTVVVLPDLSSTLPVIGTVLGGASGGVAMIVIDRIARLFGKQTDHLAETHYTVKGSWDKPIIEKLDRNNKGKAGKK